MDAINRVVMCFCLGATCLFAGLLIGYRTGWNDGKASVPPCPKVETDVGKTQPIRPVNGSNFGSPQK